MKKTEIWWKKIVVLGLIASLIAISFVITPKEEKIVLTFGMFAGNQWNVPDDNCYKIIDETIEEFEKEHPNVEIKYDSGILKYDYSEWISEKALKGDLPDVFMVLPEDFDTFSSVGVLKNLDVQISTDQNFHKEKYYEKAYQCGNFKGSQYALPYESVPKLMFVNKTLLEREGIKVPKGRWTWDDFYKICKKVTKDTDGDGKLDQFGVYDYGWEDAIYSNGGSVFNENGTQSNFTKDSVDNAILFIKKIKQLSGFQVPSSQDFDMGKIAFRPMTFSEFRTYKPYPWRINKYFNFRWDCIRLPAGPDGKDRVSVDHLMMGINKKTKHDQIAWEFLKMLTYNQNTQQKLFQYSQGISPLKEVTNSQDTEKFLKEDMEMDTGVQVSLLDEVMNRAAQIPNNSNYNTIMKYIDSEITDILQSEDQFDERILKLKRDVDKMLNQ